MPKVRVNGIDIFYQEVGAGDAEPLLLIMGWGGDHTAWAFQTPVLAGAYRVLALDNRGAGQSDAPDTPYTIAGMAADSVALLDALGIGRAHVCGASMGGMIAQEMALRHPERVRTLQLHCTLARPDAHDTLDRLSAIRVPTLITTGTEDILVPPSCSREIHARIPSSELVTIPDAGHLHFMEQFEPFNRACLGFLARHR